MRRYNCLSKSELKVKEFTVKGLSNKEIAEKLFVSEKTVKFHLGNIYKKLDVKSRADLIYKEYNPYGVAIDREENKEFNLPSGSNFPKVMPKITDIQIGMSLDQIEEIVIEQTLAYFDGNKTQASKVLGISLRALRYKANETEDLNLHG